MPESGVEPDAAETATLCTIDKPGGSEQDSIAMQAGATGINAADNHARLLFQAPVTTAK